MFAEDREPDTPEEETPDNGAPGEPGESAPEEGVAPEDSGSPGAEIEGAEALSAAAAEEPAAEEPAAEEPAAEEAAEEGEQPADEAQRDRRPPREKGNEKPEEEVIPGMHLEPDLVLEEQAREESDYGQYGEIEGDVDDGGAEPSGEDAPSEPEPVAYTPLDLAADARYRATGKRKSAVARVILKPGEGTFSVNGRHLD